MAGGQSVRWNPYLYVGANPVNYTDPSGAFFPLGVVAAIAIGGAIGGALYGYGSQVLDNLDKGLPYKDAFKCVDAGEILKRAAEGMALALGATVAGYTAFQFGAFAARSAAPFVARHGMEGVLGGRHALEYVWGRVEPLAHGVTDTVSQWLHGSSVATQVAPEISFPTSGMPVQRTLAQFQEEAQRIRDIFNLAPNKNVGIADYFVDGDYGTMHSVSGGRNWNHSGLVWMKNAVDRIFVYSTAQAEGGRETTWLDTEAKILERMVDMFTYDSVGVIDLYTERKPCYSCAGVIDQFREYFPNIKVNVLSN